MATKTRREPLSPPQEVAAYLRVSVKTLRNWRSLGEGPPWLKVGGHDVRYRMSDVDAWLEQQT